MRLRVSRRAALVALVRNGWGNERSGVAPMYRIPARGILSFKLRELHFRLVRSLSLNLNISLSPSHSLNISFCISLNVSSSLGPRLSFGLIVINGDEVGVIRAYYCFLMSLV